MVVALSELACWVVQFKVVNVLISSRRSSSNLDGKWMSYNLRRLSWESNRDIYGKPAVQLKCLELGMLRETSGKTEGFTRAMMKRERRGKVQEINKVLVPRKPNYTKKRASDESSRHGCDDE